MGKLLLQEVTGTSRPRPHSFARPGYVRRAWLVAAASLLLACASRETPVLPDDAGQQPLAEALDAGSKDADGVCALPASFGSRRCNACVVETCCGPLEVCSADATCRSLMTCILACIHEVDAGACAAECSARFPDRGATEKWSAVEECAGFTEPCRSHCATKL